MNSFVQETRSSLIKNYCLPIMTPQCSGCLCLENSCIRRMVNIAGCGMNKCGLPVIYYESMHCTCFHKISRPKYVCCREIANASDCWEVMPSDCKKASELTFEKIKRSADVMCAKKNMDGNNIGVDFDKPIHISALVW